MTYWDERAARVGGRDAAFHGIDWEEGTAAMAEQVAPHLSGTALDLGCGMGRMSARIAATGVPVVGVDASALMLADREDAAACYAVADVGALPVRTGSVGSAWSVLVAQHLSRPSLAAMFAEAARALTAGGRLVVQWVPGAGHGTGPDQRHSPATVALVASQAGLSGLSLWDAVHPDWLWGVWEA